jgi:hypothetical protein
MLLTAKQQVLGYFQKSCVARIVHTTYAAHWQLYTKQPTVFEMTNDRKAPATEALALLRIFDSWLLISDSWLQTKSTTYIRRFLESPS